MRGSPSSTRRWTAGQNPARHHDPHQADDGPDEPRIGAVRGPESSAHPRGAAQHSEHDGCDARPEQRVRDQPGPPEPERPCQDRKSTRLNSSHGYISYAVFCLKKKKKTKILAL